MENQFSNHLAGETSPYLLQHARNPVDWHPWNKESLDRAAKENKLLIISIGYAACHWCHVMEKNCFEDEDVALAMNESFLSIKVDREERPDIDQVYMNASYVVTGRGGWPLNVIALPDSRPVYAGTYFPKRDWLKLVGYFAERYKSNPAELIRQAEEIHSEIKRIDKISGLAATVVDNPEKLNTLLSEWKRIWDLKNGGMTGAPKFPMPVNLGFLLHYGFLTKNKEALRFVELTLDEMGNGGIFDQLGGGFSRYSVDDHWHIPHFEKMLYDNAQLVAIYSLAFRFFRKPHYEEIARTTLAFIERELKSPGGLFYSSLDADSEGREGEYYVWKASEIYENLGEDAHLFAGYYGITEEGNWEEGRNVLHVNEDDLCIRYGITREELLKTISASREMLFAVMQKRIPPALDNKILTSWNALMISGYVDAFKAFGEESFLVRAETVALNYKKILDNHHQLFRLYDPSNIRDPASGIRKINAFLDDYAFIIKAFLDLYQVTFNNEWLEKAGNLIDLTVTNYFDPASGLFFYTSAEDPALIDRRMELSDNVIPASNSMMALDLFIYGKITGKVKWIALSKSMLGKMDSAIFSNPSFYGNWSVLLTNVLIPPFEIAIVGSDCLAILKDFNTMYLPQSIFYGGTDESGNDMLKGKKVPGKTMIYICRDQTCSEPLESVEKALQYLQVGMER
jgi:uncharacterized protein